MSDRAASTVADVPDGYSVLASCTVAELLLYVSARIETARNECLDLGEAREYTLANEHVEDAITRFNKGVYRRKGIFAVTDAERT